MGRTMPLAVTEGLAVERVDRFPSEPLEPEVIRDLLTVCEALVRCEEDRIRRTREAKPYWSPEQGGGFAPDLELYLEAVRLARAALARVKGGGEAGGE